MAVARSALWVGVHVAEPMHNQTPATMTNCSWAHWETTKVTENRYWLLSIQQIILFTWLLKSTFTEVTFGATIFITLVHIDRLIHQPFPQISLSLIFQLFSKFLNIQPDHWLQPMNWHSLTSSQYCCQAKYGTRCTVWSSAHCEDFPSSLSFREVQKGDVMLQLPICTSCRTICKPGCGLLFLW